MSLIQDQIRDTAVRYGVDPAIALAVAQKESSFSQSARGTSGEVGIFQLMPETAGDLQVNPYDTFQNIEGGVSYLAQLYRQFGDWTKALAAYNGGPGNMARGTTPPVSWSYAKDVLGISQVYGAQPAPVGDSPELASMLPGVDIPVWAWWALAALAVGAVVLHRD